MPSASLDPRTVATGAVRTLPVMGGIVSHLACGNGLRGRGWLVRRAAQSTASSLWRLYPVRFAFAVLALLVLGGCGGAGTDTLPPPDVNQPALEEYNRRVLAADEAASAARSLAPRGPCSGFSECGTLVLRAPFRCGFSQRIAYSLVAPSSEAASAAAAHQRELAHLALSVQPPDNTSCTITERIQIPVCVASQCQF